MTSPAPPATSGAPDPAALAELAEQVALSAADLLRSGAGLHEPLANKSSATDHVTEMDRAAERLIVDALLAVRPDDGVLGEEGADHTGTSPIRWVIDPLDGTTNYVYGLPAFAVSIAAERRPTRPGDPGVVVAGSVVDVMAGRTYRASLGGGATCDGAPLRCSTRDGLASALVATGFSYDPQRRARQAAVLVEVLPRIRDIRRFGAAALDLCAVAAGRVDAYFEKGLAPWDHAAGALIASEAGAVIGGIDDLGPAEGFVVAAPPALAGPLTDLLRAAGAAAV